MTSRRHKTHFLNIVAISLLVGCSGSVDISPSVNAGPFPPVQPPVTTITEPLSAIGAISSFGSITVNGVRYETNATDVLINGQLATISDLELGQFVVLEGVIEVDNPRGRATRVTHEATVIGPVDNIDAGRGQLIVMGQTVLTNAATVFHTSVDPGSFAGLSAGSDARISGYLNANGDIIATRVEPGNGGADFQVIGRVGQLDSANMLFTVNRLTVDYGNATLIELPGGTPSNGMYVIARGSLSDGILMVEQIESLYDANGGTPGKRTQIHGTISRIASSVDFDVNGFPVTTDSGTRFTSGTVSDLTANSEITVDGDLSTNGRTIVANEITFGRVADPTTTTAFDFENFTNISAMSVFNVTVVQGSEFSVEVTADADVMNNVQVMQTGDTVSLDLALADNNVETLAAVITMPVLNRIDLGGVSRGTLRNFNQAQMTVQVGGVSALQGEGLTIANLAANVSGVSRLDLGDIRPVGTANVTVSGVSQATLNMDVGSTINGSVGTGQGTGISTLYYYGTNVDLNVTTDFLSRVIRLGGTKP